MNTGATPLFMACQNGHTETAVALLAAGAKVNQAAVKGYTPLYIACQNGHHTETAAALLAAGAKVNQAKDGGFTPLYMACQEGHTETAAALLAAGAAVDQARDDGATPLYIACHNNNLGAVQLLSSYGANRTFELHGLEAPLIATAEEVVTHHGNEAVRKWLVSLTNPCTPRTRTPRPAAPSRDAQRFATAAATANGQDGGTTRPHRSRRFSR